MPQRSISASALESLQADPLRLFDVGARAGLAERWGGHEALLKVIGFEPDPEECERLNQDAGERRQFLPFALGASDGRATFHIAAWPVASSLYPPDPAFLAGFADGGLLRTIETREVETTTLDRICEQQGSWPDVLKLDVEGAELDVLRGGDRAVSHALAIDIEVGFAPLRIGAPLFADIDRYLQDRGFSLSGLRRVFWRRSADGLEWPVLVQGDALYLRDQAFENRTGRLEAKLELVLHAYASELATVSKAWEDEGFLT